MKKYSRGREVEGLIYEIGTFLEERGCAVTIRDHYEIEVVFPEITKLFYTFSCGYDQKLYVKEIILYDEDNEGPLIKDVLYVNLMDFGLLPSIFQDYILINPDVVWDLGDSHNE